MTANATHVVDPQFGGAMMQSIGDVPPNIKGKWGKGNHVVRVYNVSPASRGSQQMLSSAMYAAGMHFSELIQNDDRALKIRLEYSFLEPERFASLRVNDNDAESIAGFVRCRDGVQNTPLSDGSYAGRSDWYNGHERTSMKANNEADRVALDRNGANLNMYRLIRNFFLNRAKLDEHYSSALYIECSTEANNRQFCEEIRCIQFIALPMSYGIGRSIRIGNSSGTKPYLLNKILKLSHDVESEPGMCVPMAIMHHADAQYNLMYKSCIHDALKRLKIPKPQLLVKTMSRPSPR